MDISKFYELRSRLYNAAAAGCMTVSEDFRLKRAVEDFKPLAEANKAFAKLYSLCAALLSSDKPESVIPDCIALADALAVTQGTFADNSEMSPAEGIFAPTEKPASALAAVETLIHKGSAELWKLPAEYKDTLRDPRVIFAFLNELEAGKSNENINMFCEIMCEICGKALVPALKASVRTSGRQLQYIVKLSGDEENEFFRALATDENTPEKVRLAAISALSCSPENGALLAELFNTGKAKVKQAALLAMAEMDAPEAEPIFEKLLENYDKNKKTLGEAVIASSGRACTEFVRKYLLQLDSDARTAKDEKVKSRAALELGSGADYMLENKTELDEIYLARAVERECQRKGISRGNGNLVLIKGLYGKKEDAVRAQIDRLYEKAPGAFAAAKMVSDLIYKPDSEPAVSDDVFSSADPLGLFTYIPLLGKYFVPHTPYYSNECLLKPVCERLPGWLIQHIRNSADKAESEFKQLETLKRTEAPEKSSKTGIVDTISYKFDKITSKMNGIASNLRTGLLSCCAPEDLAPLKDAAAYFAKKCCKTVGGFSVLTLLDEQCPEIGNKQFVDILNTSVVNTIKMQNTSGRNFPLHYMAKRFTSDELLAGWKDLRERVAALRGSLDDKVIDDELYLIDSWIKRF